MSTINYIHTIDIPWSHDRMHTCWQSFTSLSKVMYSYTQLLHTLSYPRYETQSKEVSQSFFFGWGQKKGSRNRKEEKESQVEFKDTLLMTLTHLTSPSILSPSLTRTGSRSLRTLDLDHLSFIPPNSSPIHQAITKPFQKLSQIFNMTSTSFWSILATCSHSFFHQLRDRFSILPLPKLSTKSIQTTTPRLILPRLSSHPDLLARRLNGLSIASDHTLSQRLIQVEDLLETNFSTLAQQLIDTFPTDDTDSALLDNYLSLLVRKYRQLYNDQVDGLLHSLCTPASDPPSKKPLSSKPRPSGRHGRPQVFTKHQTTVLYELLRYDDKLTLNEKMFVAERLGLTKDQVNRWVSQFSIIIHFYPMILSASELIDARLSVPIMLLLVSFVTPERVDWVRNAKQPSTPRS